MYDMNSLLIDAPGWMITTLYGINDSNQVVGIGVVNGVEHAVLLTDPPPPGVLVNTSNPTPEPGSWGYCLLATLFGLLLRLQRSRRACRERVGDNPLGLGLVLFRHTNLFRQVRQALRSNDHRGNSRRFEQ
jgi:hypothetical protein